MIVIQGEMRVHPDDVGKLREIAAPFIAANRQEKGNQAYFFAEDLLEPGLIHIAERWDDQAAVDAHNVAPHSMVFVGGVQQLRMLGIKVTGYDSAGPRVLLG
jgi:quinol monooxygenase YgiN